MFIIKIPLGHSGKSITIDLSVTIIDLIIMHTNAFGDTPQTCILSHACFFVCARLYPDSAPLAALYWVRGGYPGVREAAEAIAAQKETCVVEDRSQVTIGPL